MSLMGRYEEAFAAIGRALALNPNNPDAYVSRARVLNAIGRAFEAEESVRKAMRIDPHFPADYRRVLAMSLFHQEKYREAVDALQPLLDLNTETADDYTTLVASLGHLGETKGVAAAIQRFNDIVVGGGYSPMTVLEQGHMFWYGDIFDYHRPYLDKLAEGLRKAGVPEGQVNPDFPQFSKLMHRSMGEYTVDGTTKIGVETAKALRDRGVTFIDVRAPKDFARGHVPGAKNIDVKTDMTRERLLQEASANDEVVFSCHGRYCMDSACAAAKAVTWGFTRVYYFAGGFPTWREAGYPVEKSPNP
jgi:rhodanese-related sulfurtransferase